MEAPLASHPLVRVTAVTAPFFALAIVLGSQLGEGHHLIGILLPVCILMFLLALSLGKRGLLEASIVSFLICGYFVGNRGFAQLYVVAPIFLGELGLGIVLVLLTTRAVLTRELPSLRDPLARMILLFLFYASVRFAFDFREYKIDAIRDFAIVYYSLFFFIGLQLGAVPSSRAFMSKCLTVTLAAHAVAALMFLFARDLLQNHLFIRGAPLFIQKGDLTATFSAVGIVIIVNRQRAFGLRWLRNLLLLVFVASVALNIARAAILAVLAVSVLLWISGKRTIVFYPFIGGALAAICVLALVASGSSINKMDQVALFQEKFASMVDVTGNYHYETDLGEMKSDNNEFRRTFWRTVFRDTTSSNPIFGKGFGYNFLPKFEATYARGTWEGLRSPHNYYVTIYGRLGAVGLLLLISITFLIARAAVRAAVLVRQNKLDRPEFGYWCAAVVILISGAFGVVLEGPMGGIPFWTFLGLAASTPIRSVVAEQRRALMPGESVGRFTPAHAGARSGR